MLGVLTLAAVTAHCPIERAHYSLRTAPAITASFRDVAPDAQDWPAHLAFGVTDAKSGRTFWFLPWPGGTDDLQNLASTKDVTAPGWRPPSPDDGPRPLGDLQLVITDAAYSVIDDIPRAGGVAPAHILVPELGDRLWHGVMNGDFVRVVAPKQFFDLVRCG